MRKLSSRLFLVIATLIAVAAADSPALAAKINNAQELKAARQKAAWKQRRVIMNNDGNDSRGASEKTRKGFLQTRSTPLIGTQTDAIFYCTGIWGTFTHKSPTADLRSGADYGYKEWGAYLDKDGGPDSLGTLVDFGHKNNMEVFWSLRMNDTHDSGDPTMMSPWKKSHADCLVGNWKDRGKYRGGGRRWSGVDYLSPTVQDRTVGWFDEVAEKYDIDGVELDYFRHLIFFKSTLHGKEATQEERDAMTSVVRRIRKAIDRHALRRGRPILLAIRVPDSLDYCRAVGLDVEKWLQEGLVDIMTPSGYFRLGPWKTSVELGHKYNVPVYAGLSESRFRDKELQRTRQSIEGYRGRAAEAWASGVDGIYTFNYFNPKALVFRQLGDPAELAGMDKIYTTGSRGTRAVGYWLRDGNKYMKRPYPLPDKPKTLALGKPIEIELGVFDDPQQTKATVTLKLCVEGLQNPADITVAVNGTKLAVGKLDGRWVEYPLDSATLKRGTNSFTLKLTKKQKSKVLLKDLIVSFDH